MLKPIIARAALTLVVAATTAACTGTDASTAPTNLTTAPTATVTTEAFEGTVPVGGSDSHGFNVMLSNGQVNVILTAASPPATIYMGIGVGTYSGTTCTLLSNGSVVAPAGSVAQLVGTLNAGAYCVEVYDAGNQTSAVTYAVTVNHY